MIAYIGQGLLGASALCAAVGTVIPLSLSSQKRWALGLFAFLLGAFSLLIYAHLVSDFSILNVFRHSHTSKPFLYKIAGVWGNHEGSMLMWVVMLSGYIVAMAYGFRSLDEAFQKISLTIAAAISFFFCLFLLSACDPFTPLLLAPRQGMDLNPLLQDPALAIHPPCLYMGYVGFVLPFILALSVLLQGPKALTQTLILFLYKSTLVAWLFLTAGLALGSFWAYYELGWGGWWAWDPVENAALMPWICGAALLHTLHIVRHKNAMIRSALFLSLLAFSFALFGLLLVRSGLLTSVHSFAVDPERGLILLSVVGILCGAAFGVFVMKQRAFATSSSMSFQNRTGYVVLGVLVLLCCLSTLVIGTLYPLLAESFGQLVSVGGPYFKATVVPMSLPVFFLMGLAPFYKWFSALDKNAQSHIVGSLILTGISLLIWHSYAPFYSLLQVSFIGVGIFSVLGSILIGIFPLVKEKMIQNIKDKLPMVLSHAGIGLMIIGMTVSSYGEQDYLKAVSLNTMLSVPPYDIELVEIKDIKGPNYTAQQAEIQVYKQGSLVKKLYPEKRFYWTQKILHGETSLYHDGLNDLYISIGEEYKSNIWSMRFYYKPGINLLWLGVFVVILGMVGALVRRRSSLSRG